MNFADTRARTTMRSQFGIETPRLWARVSGVCWLLTIAGGVFAEGLVKSNIIVGDDAAATLSNIAANEPTYRLAIAAEFGGTATYLALSAILYLLLAPVNRPLSLTAAFFSVAGCTIWFLNTVAGMAPLVLQSIPAGAEHGSIQAAAFALVRLGDEGLMTGMLCFGVHCLLLGFLFARSRFFPWPIGLALSLGGVGYLVGGVAHIAAPDFASQIDTIVHLPGLVGESLTALWLTLVGVNAANWVERAA
ncbi:MAG: DUF4386 domain-containing protein [Terricaulis silvestris]